MSDSPVVLHVPHDAVEIPADVRDPFLLDEAELMDELRRMTDHFTLALFCGGKHPAAGALSDGISSMENSPVVVRAPVSRLVVDVERFADDAVEPMAAIGMGVIYRTTSSLLPLRRELLPGEREALLEAWYRPHHRRLEKAVDEAVTRHGRCLVIDCHSFPSMALPYERGECAAIRPDICIGTDDFHTGELLAQAFVEAFADAGWSVELNRPFAGALVPASRYRRDARVSAVMVEVNRRLYLNEAEGTPLAGFDAVAERVRACWERAAPRCA